MPERRNHTFAVLAYNESAYLEDCVIALRKQSVKSDIFLSTSTPSVFLMQLADKYGIPLVVNVKKMGIAFDWSFAYNKAKTKYVTLVHQDDLYLPKYAESCLFSVKDKILDKSIIIFTDYGEMLEDSRIRWISANLIIKKMFLWPFLFTDATSSTFLKKMILSFGSPIPCPSVTYNKERIGYFEFSDKLTCNMDWDAWLRLIDKPGSYVYIKKRLMFHRIHRYSQTSFQIDKKIRAEEDQMMFERLWPKLIAAYLSMVYRVSLKSNRIKD